MSLRRATLARDIRVILDIAPNHTGAEHPWFVAAQADPSAPTAGFYTFRSRPDDYESWLGVKSLPKLDYRDAGLREAMYAGQGAILRRWLEPPFSADGWRIDVANMLGRQGPVQLGPEVARGMRAAVKDANPDAYLMGEHFYDATDALNGDQWDGVMNYAGFTNPVLEWLSVVEHRSAGFGTVVAGGARTTDEMVASLDAFRAAIPWAVARCQYDLLGSHDTPRVRSVVGDPGRLRAAFGLLFGYVGVPGFLYGDEVGLQGEEGNASRLAMPWNEEAWDLDHLEFTRALVRFRARSRALQAGGFQVLETGADSLAFLRDTDDEQVIVIVVRGPGSRTGDLRWRSGRSPTAPCSPRSSPVSARRSPAAACRCRRRRRGRPSGGPADDRGRAHAGGRRRRRRGDPRAGQGGADPVEPARRERVPPVSRRPVAGRRPGGRRRPVQLDPAAGGEPGLRSPRTRSTHVAFRPPRAARRDPETPGFEEIAGPDVDVQPLARDGVHRARR